MRGRPGNSSPHPRWTCRKCARDVSREPWSLCEATYITLDAPLRAPLLCTANNARLTLEWLEEMRGIYRDAAVDLLRVNRERKDRLRLLRRAQRP